MQPRDVPLAPGVARARWRRALAWVAMRGFLWRASEAGARRRAARLEAADRASFARDFCGEDANDAGELPPRALTQEEADFDRFVALRCFREPVEPIRHFYELRVMLGNFNSFTGGVFRMKDLKKLVVRHPRMSRDFSRARDDRGAVLRVSPTLRSTTNGVVDWRPANI